MLSSYASQITDATNHFIVVMAPNASGTSDGGATSIAANLLKVQTCLAILCNCTVV
jgi:hypothetical protein